MQSARHSHRVWERCRPVEETLGYAEELASLAGIVEVRELTPLDQIGIPVFACSRPHALADVVTYGKGMTPIAAEVGAYMEAFEYYFAEPGSSDTATKRGSIVDLCSSGSIEETIGDLIPLHGIKLDLDAPLLLANAHDLESGQQSWLPAELVFRPSPEPDHKYFGSSTNGLAAGNSLEEASFCALLELIERDIWSLELARQSSRLVEAESLPQEVLEILERVQELGLELIVRSVPNDYGLPFFATFLFDRQNPSLEYFNGGYGCSFSSAEAALESVLEAVQGRIGMIDGRRKQPQRHSGQSAEKVRRSLEKQFEQVCDATSPVAFSEISDASITDAELGPLKNLIPVLRRGVTTPIYRVVLTSESCPLQVVRLIVPTLEHYKLGRVRVGRRLRAALSERSVNAEAN